MLFVGYGFVRCIIVNEENFGNIEMCYVFFFVEWCVIVCKVYIYNEYIIIFDCGFINGG